MRYLNILRYVAATPWAILPAKMAEILAVLSMRAAGDEFTSEEIRARIGDGPPETAPSTKGNIAIVPLRGVIAHRMDALQESSGGMSAERFTRVIRALTADESVGTILIDSDSPGGTITGVPEAAQAVFEARETKRVVAIANGAMASAAYWIASQAHETIAIPSVYDGAIGSIGVFAAHRDLSAALEQAGIKVTLIFAGEHKVTGNELEPLSDERRAEIQAMVNQAYARFVKDVARGRNVSVAEVKSGFGQGRGVSATDAKVAGLIDRIATFDETIARLAGTRRAVVGGGARAEDGEPALQAAETPSTVEEPTPTPAPDAIKPGLVAAFMPR